VVITDLKIMAHYHEEPKLFEGFKNLFNKDFGKGKSGKARQDLRCKTLKAFSEDIKR
jgi:hypothetical protein